MLAVAVSRNLHADQGCRRLVVRELFVFDQSGELFVVWIVKKIDILGQNIFGRKDYFVELSTEKRQGAETLGEKCVGSNRVDDDIE